MSLFSSLVSAVTSALAPNREAGKSRRSNGGGRRGGTTPVAAAVGKAKAKPTRPGDLPAPAAGATPLVRELSGPWPKISYEPRRDGEPDPGEVVWAWVPYQEDPTQGKDRPVLLLGRTPGEFLGLQLTSKDHDRDAAQEAAAGRYWHDVGTGEWDRQGRPSEVRLDRPLLLSPAAIRREGAALDAPRFNDVVNAARQWQRANGA